MKSEEYAKTLLCPKKLDNENEDDRFCETSACMVWVWGEDRKIGNPDNEKGDCGLIFPSFISVGGIGISKR